MNRDSIVFNLQEVLEELGETVGAVNTARTTGKVNFEQQWSICIIISILRGILETAHLTTSTISALDLVGADL